MLEKSDLRLAMEEEDERLRGAIKQAAYNCEEDTLAETVELLLAMSKQRQREIFAQHNWNQQSSQ